MWVQFGLCRSLLGVLLGLLLQTLLGTLIGLLGKSGLLLGVSLGSLGCVYCFSLKDCRMCPFTFASDFGRYFSTSCSMSPGHVKRILLLVVVFMADVHGLQHVRWRKLLRSDFILFHTHYRQKDAQEFCIPSYSHFVRWLEEPCIEWNFCHVFRAWQSCWFLCQ